MEAKVLRTLGMNLNRLRQKAGLTQEKMAENSDISLRYWQKLEQGVRNPSIETLARIHKALGCKWDDLFKGI